jgi:xanthine/uracil permease
MPVLVLGVVSFLIFLTIGALGIWAVMKEQKQEHGETQGK